MSSVIPSPKHASSALELARELALSAGALLFEQAGGVRSVTSKGRANIVTDADFAAEALILPRLREEYPEWAIVSEEAGRSGGTSDYYWIIDPLDGTRNYAMGLPHYAVNIALAQGERVVLGVTYDPSRRELFWAERGRGAYLNERPLRIERAVSLEQSVLGTDMGYSDSLASHDLALLHTLWPGMQAIRVMGSAALGMAYVACGRYDLYFHHSLSSWDIAPGVLLVEEAGGVLTDRKGSPLTLESPSLIVGNAVLHAEFLARTAGMPWRTA